MAKRKQANPAAPATAGGGTNAELKQRLLFVLGALVVFRIGTFIPVPGIDPIALQVLFDQQRGTILDMFNMFSGGALQRFSIFAIGIMPYISAAIIMQLLTHVDPRLKELRKEGEAGRRKITRYTRYGTVALATFQSLGVAIALESQGSGAGSVVLNPGIGFRVTAVVTLVTGTMFLMWLGEQLHDDGGRDVRHDADGKNTEPLERPTREHVEHVQDGAALRIEQRLQRDRINARNRNEGSDSEHHQRAQHEQKPCLELG